MAGPKLTSPPLTASAAEFRAALPDGGALLGIDTGTRTIGTALCDAGWRFATAAKPIAKGKFARGAFAGVRAAIAALVAERGVKGLVIGLPLNMDGSESPRSQSARAFARNLAQEPGGLGLPILLWDERWSTQAAARALIAQDMSRAKRAERIDSAAAATILQAAIDALAGSVV